MPSYDIQDEIENRDEMTMDTVARVTVSTLGAGENTFYLESDEHLEIGSDGPVSVDVESTKEPATVERPPAKQGGDGDD